eukprot:gene2661-2906_t
MPTWTPLCRCMQLYCEPYFTAINFWRKYQNVSLLENRILVVEMMAKILADYTQSTETYVFKLAYENADCELLPQVISSAGLAFIEGGDRRVFENARSLVPDSMFNKCGIFFQTNVLKPVAGFSEELLASSNLETRRSVIEALELLFRLPEEAGKVKIVFRQLNTLPESTEESEMSLFHPFPESALSVPGKRFVEFLVDSCNDVSNKAATPKQSTEQQATKDPTTNGERKKRRNSGAERTLDFSPAKKAKKPTSGRKAKKSEAVESEPVEWTTDHPSVGTNVAFYFSVVKGKRNVQSLFEGKVTKYAPPSAPEEKDQLYHIVWEDGDEEDYDERQLQKGRALYNKVARRGDDGESSNQKEAAAEEAEFTLEEPQVLAVESQPQHESDSSSDLEPKSEQKNASAVEAVSLEEVATKEEEEEVEWTKDHPAVGTKVAAYFGSGRSKRLYKGEVTQYAPPSKEGADDQLYRIGWEDGDEEDYDEKQLKRGIALFEEDASGALQGGSSSKKNGRRRSSSKSSAQQTPGVDGTDEAAVSQDLNSSLPPSTPVVGNASSFTQAIEEAAAGSRKEEPIESSTQQAEVVDDEDSKDTDGILAELNTSEIIDDVLVPDPLDAMDE